VNDTLGHDAGDELLPARRRRAARDVRVRASDTVARVGGDEFALLLDPAGRPGRRRRGSRLKIRAALQEPFALTDGEARISASIGIAL
jgi:diguanylate cyclase (GGDEF)-like protein